MWQIVTDPLICCQGMPDSFLLQKMKESEKKLSNCSSKQSINKSQLQGDPLTKQDILDVYSDVLLE